jgi:hypothetical protein
MGKLALLLSVLALGGAGWAVYALESRPHAECGDGRDAVVARLAAIERSLAELKARPAPAVPLEAPATPSVATGGGTPTLGPLLTPPQRRAATVEERLAAIEKGLAESREAGTRATLADGEEAQLHPVGQAMPGFWTDVESAAKAMKLESVQASRLEGIVESTRRELDALYDRPNEEGLKWKDVNEELKLDATEPGELMSKIGEHMKKVSKFRNGKIPGSNETYGEAERRIRKEGKDRGRSLLDADQAKVWDRSHPDALFGGQLGGDSLGAVTFFSSPTFETVLPEK